MTNQKNLYQRLLEVRKVADFILKADLRNEDSIKENKKGLGFKAVSSSMTLLKVNQAINENGLILETEVINKTVESREYTNSYGKPVKDWITILETKMTWVNVDNPTEKSSLNFGCIASNPNASQSFGSALTYNEKYFILKYFNIPTDELDPDVIVNNMLSSEDKDRSILDKLESTNFETVDQLTKFYKENLSNITDKERFLKACTVKKEKI